MRIPDPDDMKSRSPLLTLEAEHIPDWGLIVIAIVLAFPMLASLMLAPFTQDKAIDVTINLCVATAITLLVLELPYFMVLCVSKYRRAIFSSAGVERQIVYRLWETQSQWFEWDEVTKVVCVRTYVGEGLSGLRVELHLVGGMQEDLIRLNYSEGVVSPLRGVCAEIPVSEA